MNSKKITRSVVASILLLGTSSLYATGPGNVSTNLQLWLKADTTTAGGGTLSATDDSGNTNHATQADSAKQPTIVANGINFNKTFRFDGINDTLKGTNNLTTDTVTSYTVYTSSSTAGFRSPFTNRSSASNDSEGYAYYTQGTARQVWFGTNGALWSKFSNANLTLNEAEIFGFNTDTPAGGAPGAFQSITINGVNTSNSPVGADYQKQATTIEKYRLGSGDDEGNAAFFWKGDIAEQIVYSAKLNPAQKRQVESYLALKYGITLDTTTLDYTNRNAMGPTSIVWTHSATYNKNIIGIGKDDATSLNQEISKSVHSGAILTLSSDSDFTGLNGTHTDLANGNYLIVGNDGAATTAQTTDLDLTVYSKRTSRVWKGDSKTGLKIANFKFDGFDDSWVLIKIPKTSDSFATNVTTVGPLNANGEILNVTVDDEMRFTLAKLSTTLADIGTDADGGADLNPTAVQLNNVTGVTGAISTNEGAYQIYINTYPNRFSSPATAAEVQTMVTQVNTNQALLVGIGTDADDGGSTTTNPTAAQLNALTNVTGALATNEGDYQTYINTHPNEFSAPATEAEVQAMITAVNLANRPATPAVIDPNQTFLTNIGVDANGGRDITPTAAQFNALPNVTGAIATNEGAYQEYINTHPNEFSSPATEAEIQAMITTVNTFTVTEDADNHVTEVVVPDVESTATFTGVAFTEDTTSTDTNRSLSSEPSTLTTDDIKDETTDDATCGNVTYTAYVVINSDGTMKSGYKRVSAGAGCTLENDDSTVKPAFAAGTKLNVRETSTEEKLEYGNSGVVIVSDVPLDDDITLGGI